jgi:polyisoprenoid-binding protein YceI
LQTPSCQQPSGHPARGGRAPAAALGALAAIAALGVLAAHPAAADRLELVPRADAVRFTLGATLHDVEGEIDLVSGEIVFQPSGGECTGEIVLDARSADTDNDRRDTKMHQEALESDRFPRIVFRPRRLAVEERSDDEARVRLEGVLELHGVERPFAIPARITRDATSPAGSGDAPGTPVSVEAEFDVRYVEWDVADVSNFLLRVDDSVRVRLRALGRWLPAAPSDARSPGP